MPFKKDSGNYKSMQEARKLKLKKLGLKPKTQKEFFKKNDL